MKYRLLGSTGTAVSSLALGTMYFGQETPEAEAFEILDAFVEAGGTLIDTANVYTGSESEKIIGRWFASRPRDLTDPIILATKGRYGGGDDPNAAGLSRRSLARALEASLKRLNVEAVDLYQMHGWDPLTPAEKTLRFLEDSTKNGKIHYYGLSNFTGWQLQLFLSTAKELGIAKPATLQQQYSLLSRESEWEVIPATLHNGLGLLPWSPLAGGFLAGKYQRGVAPLPDTRAGSRNELYQWVSAEYAQSDCNWNTIGLVEKVAREIGATPVQVSLSWIADRPSVTAPIFGARTLKHLQENVAAAGLTLDAEVTAALEEVSAPQSGGYPYGAFGASQRGRYVDQAGQALGPLVAGGSKHPTGQA